MVIEAKAPGESLSTALNEARMYSCELNALFAHQINPCVRLLVCNGEELWSSFADAAEPDIKLPHAAFSVGNIQFAQLIESCRREALQAHANRIRNRLRHDDYRRPVTLVGGSTFQSEELPQNTFGATIVGDYGHIFNPQRPEDRELIAREAYVASLRRQRYVEPIDRLIRNAVAPRASKVPPLENSANQSEITAALRDRKKLENQVLLLIGSVGAGKSTFIDYLSLVALPADLRDRTVWIRLNLNLAPLSQELIYRWTAEAIVAAFRTQFPNIAFDEFSQLEKIFRKELTALRKGPLSILDPTSTDYKVRVADRLTALQSDPIEMAKGLTAYLCSGAERLLVVVLDNCDKRTRDEQLTMFQIAHWVQGEFQCLVVLPLRDVTYDLYHGQPPLNTALKQFVFRIEPPQFSDVLQKRIRLALSEIARNASSSNSFSYQLPNGIRVTYPAEDQALYLASILRSLYAHDRFVRQVMTGLAGRDVRRALEIFLEFCMSGHIGEDEIFKIRVFEGRHVLPLSLVARVLLRMQRRYYDGTRSYIKNIVQCEPSDPFPDHFVRLTLLHWFEGRLRTNGPAGVEGFHRAADMIADLSVIGHDADRVREELSFLTKEGCLVAEHLRSEDIADDDLLKTTASGVVHLQLMANPEYLAACAEDTWIGDAELCKRVAQRLGSGVTSQFSPLTTARNATEFVEYLQAAQKELLRSPDSFLEPERAFSVQTLREAEAGIKAAEIDLPERLYVGSMPYEVTEEELSAALTAAGIELSAVTLPRDKTTGLNRGFAFLRTRTKQSTFLALDLDGKIVLRGRRLRIGEAYPMEEEHPKGVSHERPQAPLSERVYVGNLPYSLDEVDLRALLAEQDVTPVDLFLLFDKTTGKFRGSCLIVMETLDAAAQVIGALNGLQVEGRTLVARAADPRQKTGKDGPKPR